MSTILFELGCEELPPTRLKTLRDALKASVVGQLEEHGISFGEVKAFAAPRRLAIQISQTAEKQPDRTEQKKGPAVKAAFDAEGQPTKAAMGFAKGLGIEPRELITIATDKGEYIGYDLVIRGQAVDELLPAIFQQALDKLPIAKRMTSGTSKEQFVRPVQWVVLMRDDATITATIQGHQTANKTRGHRFHAPEVVAIEHADDYESLLSRLKVLADFDKRQASILKQVTRLAEQVQATAIIPDELLDEVTALVDLPVALRATFEERFLQVPQEALIKTMQADQKYFCLTDTQGKLLPYFIFISNIDSKDPKQVILGNEKVVRPRLADAEFFFLQDQKEPLYALTEKLKNQVFQEQLGTIWDKSERIAKLAAFIATLLKEHGHAIDIEEATRAGVLAKADLASSLVYEFPEMQGIAGTYYATLNEEPTAVAAAIEQQYLPRFSGDKLPSSPIGICLALADRLDTLVGIFGIGQAPTGSKDPFSLRRSAIGVLRILIEKKLPINLVVLLEQALKNYNTEEVKRIEALGDTFTQVMDFISSRYRAMYTEKGVRVDTIQSVQAINPHMPLDFDQRVRAVQTFRSLPQAANLAANNKRVANILAKSNTKVANFVNDALLEQQEEKDLFAAVNSAKEIIQPLQEQADYETILAHLAKLEAPLTAFFDNVMVNSENKALQGNRLTLLKQVRELFLIVADIGELQD